MNPVVIGNISRIGDKIVHCRNLICLQFFFNLPDQRRMSPIQSAEQFPFRILICRPDLFQFFQSQAKRFLAIDTLTRLQCLHYKFCMAVMPCGYCDQINLRISQQFFIMIRRIGKRNRIIGLGAAQARPDWGFLLLGAVEEGNPFLRQLDRLSNVYLPGPRPATEVPDWLYRCQVLVDLLREDQPFGDVISPRLYEYLATGKPVVSMLWPDQVEQFADVVYGAHDQEEFLPLCDHALREAPGLALRRRERAAKASWPRRAGEVERILTTAGLL